MSHTYSLLEPTKLLAAVLGLVVGVLLLSGCGSSKPAFCSHVSELEESVKTLTKLNPGSISALQQNLQKVDTDAKAVVSSAKSEFPTQTAAIEKSLSALDDTATEISSMSPEQATKTALSTVPGEVIALGSALSEFSSATKSKCD